MKVESFDIHESWGFNRINPNRSIPTEEDMEPDDVSIIKFQSYQSKQINPDSQYLRRNNGLRCNKFQSYQSKQINPDVASHIQEKLGLPGFNRINPNRSIPTCYFNLL